MIPRLPGPSNCPSCGTAIKKGDYFPYCSSMCYAARLEEERQKRDRKRIIRASQKPYIPAP